MPLSVICHYGRLNTLMDVVLLECRCACSKLHNFVQVEVTILLENETYLMEKLLHCRAGTMHYCRAGILMLYIIISFCCQLNVMSTIINYIITCVVISHSSAVKLTCLHHWQDAASCLM